MGGALMTGPGEVRVEDHAKATILQPPTRLSGCRRPASAGRTCGATAGSTTNGAPRGDMSTAGIGDEIGSAATTVKPGQFAGAGGSPDDRWSSSGWLTAERPTTVQPQEPDSDDAHTAFCRPLASTSTVLPAAAAAAPGHHGDRCLCD